MSEQSAFPRVDEALATIEAAYCGLATVEERRELDRRLNEARWFGWDIKGPLVAAQMQLGLLAQRYGHRSNKPNTKKQERNERIRADRARGISLGQLASENQLSKSRVQQIVNNGTSAKANKV
jgi:hypothetical protein